VSAPARTGRERGGLRDAALTTVAGVAVLVAPLVPGMAGSGPAALVGLPAESIVVVLTLLIIRRRRLRIVAAGVFGTVVMAAILVAALDAGFSATIDRPFDVAEDGGALVDAFGVAADALGIAPALTIVAVAGALLVAGAWGLARSALRIGRRIEDAGSDGRIGVGAVTAAWVVFALAGAQVVPGVPAAASRSGDELVATSSRSVTSIRELRAFEEAMASDRLEAIPRHELLSALAGKDVVIAFVESYGRVAVEPSAFTDGVRRALSNGADTLARTGYAARSAFLTSPTFGGVSWLAHATLQSGVRVDSQQKYARLLSSDRLTLSGLFGAAGWHTIAVVPSNARSWEEGEAFYGFDSMFDSRNMSYRGPAFGYARMPDQYTWSVLHDNIAAGPGPVMAEVDLVSSHTPWTPLPQMVPWSQLGDGSVFASQPASADTAVEVWADGDRVRELYGQAIEYSLDATFSSLEAYPQRDLVVVLLGDHQPARIVSGADAGYGVPVTIIASDPAVLDAIASWGWEEGVHPSAAAPVWRMEEFRDRFVRAFSR
jgi:hypothetical protein